MTPRAPSDRYLFFAFCLLLVWAPIPLGSNRVWAMQLLQAWIGLIAAGLCWQIGRDHLPLTNALQKAWIPVTALSAISLWTLIQILPPPLSPLGSSTKNLTSGYLALQKSLAYALLFLCALQLLSSPQRLERAAHVIVLSGVIQAVYAVLVSLGGPAFDLLGLKLISPFKDATTGTFVNRNHLAGYLEMTLAVGIGLLMAKLESAPPNMSWRERSRRFLRALLEGKARVRLFLVIMVIALVMTHSRMGNSAFFASMGISAMIGFFIYRKVSRSLVILFASMIIIDLFIISAWFGLDKLATRIEQTHISEEVRLDVNANAWPWVENHWLSGSGAGSFGSQFPAYRTADISPFFDFAHNDYLQILGEYGVIGAVFFVLVVLSSLWAAITAQRQRQNQVLRGMAFAAMMGITSLMIHASVDFNHYIPANAMLFILLCGFAWAARYMDTSQKKRRFR
jgi:putative inorganic carbon (HCO3(-)) transporter